MRAKDANKDVEWCNDIPLTGGWMEPFGKKSRLNPGKGVKTIAWNQIQKQVRTKAYPLGGEFNSPKFQFQCCGVGSYKDWIDNSPDFSILGAQVPKSCCTGASNVKSCIESPGSYLHGKPGCWDGLSNYMGPRITWLLLLLFILMVAQVSANNSLHSSFKSFIFSDN